MFMTGNHSIPVENVLGRITNVLNNHVLRALIPMFRQDMCFFREVIPEITDRDPRRQGQSSSRL
jgi:hypothetical protein